jgi:hypothetical protein
VRIIGAVFGFFRLVTPKARRVFREAGTGIEPVFTRGALGGGDYYGRL